MTALSMIKTAGIAAALTVGLGLAAAVPAQAQSFGFSIGGGHGQPSFGFSIGDDNRFNGRPGLRCVPTRSLDDVIENQGYRNVRITNYGRRTVDAVGRRNGWLYEISADACTGRIYDTDRLRRG